MAGKKGRSGAKLTLNEELIEEICKYIENGMTNVDACEMAGVAENTFYLWLNKAQNPNEKEIYVKLLQSIKKAEKKFKLFHISNINKSAPKNWQASAWILERKYPKDYARIDRLAVVKEEDNGMLKEFIDAVKGDVDE